MHQTHAGAVLSGLRLPSQVAVGPEVVTYGFKRRGRISLREKMERNLASLKLQSMTGTNPLIEKFEAHMAALPPKRSRVRRPVDGKPVQPSEHQEQVAVIHWWRTAHKNYGLPEFALFAVPNGGSRDIITASRLKAEGVRAGVLDLVLAVPRGIYHGAFIEMKAGYNKPSDKQQEFIEFLRAGGYQASVHWSADSAIAQIKEYLQ